MDSKLDRFDALKSNLLALFPELSEVYKQLGLDEKADYLSSWREKLREERFVLMITGDFSRGKSTLINALLGKKILPSRLTPCTGAINAIRYGETPRAVKTYRDSDREPENISFEQFLQEVSLPQDDEDDPAEPESEERLNLSVNQALAEYPVHRMELFYPLELCRKGVEIIDSPGLNEDERQTAITHKYLTKSDAVVVTTAATKQLAANERTFIRKLVESGTNSLFFVSNFVDLVDDEDEMEELEEEAREFLEEILGNRPLRLFFVSAKDALLGKMENDAEKVAGSGFERFESELQSFLVHERGCVQLENVARLLSETIEEQRERIQGRETLLKTSLSDLLQKRDVIQPRLEDLEKRKAAIFDIIERFRKETKKQVIQDLREFLRRLVEHDLEIDSKNWKSDVNIGMLQHSGYKKCTEQFIKQADRFLKDRFDSWSRNQLAPFIQNQAEKLQKEIGEEAREILQNLDEIKIIIHPDAQMRDYSGEQPRPLIERLCAAGVGFVFLDPVTGLMGGIFGARQAAEQFALNIGTIFAMVFLGVFNAPLFFAAAGFIAMIRGWSKVGSAKEKIRDKIVQEIQNRLRYPGGEMEDNFRNTIDGFFLDFREGLMQGIDDRIQGVRSEIDHIVAQKQNIDADLASASKEATQMLERLNAINADLEKISESIEQCCSEPSADDNS